MMLRMLDGGEMIIKENITNHRKQNQRKLYRIFQKYTNTEKIASHSDNKNFGAVVSLK